MRPVAVSVLFFLLIACGAPQPRYEIPPTSRKPIGLIPKAEISGDQLGYILLEPSGVAIDAHRNLFVSDRGNNRIIKFDANFNPLDDFGGYGSGVGQFIYPEDIFIERGLNLYVLDSGNRRVVHLDNRLNYIEEIIPEDDSAEIVANRGVLSGLVLSGLGEMSVVDYDNSRLIRLDNFFKFSRYVGDFGYGSGALLNPVDMAFGRDNNYYVADQGNGRIAVYDDYGNFIRSIGDGLLERPTAVALSPHGVVWVADGESGDLLAFGSTGMLLFRFPGIDGADEFRSHDVRAMTISRESVLYIADGDHNRILVFDIAYEGE